MAFIRFNFHKDGKVFKRKKSPFLMTFLFAPLIVGMLQPNLNDFSILKH